MEKLPRLRFAHLPTPVEEMPRLSAALGGPRLLIKRDDLTGLAMGGNKTRKLEYLLAQAQADGARRLITAGAIQSNHCRQTAAAAARFGFECTLVLYPTSSQEDPTVNEQIPSGNLLLDQLLGAEIVWTQKARRDQTLKATFENSWERGQKPYLIPYGGSSPTGAAAYVFALNELIAQQHIPDWIVFPSSSGGTHAGLALGAYMYKFSGKIFGISVDEEQDTLQKRVASLASETANLLRESYRFSPEDILVEADYLGGGYGVMGENEREAIRLFAINEGLLLDPVYTARAAGGMINLIRNGKFKKGQTVLFWHTGGTPALFAEKYRQLGEKS